MRSLSVLHVSSYFQKKKKSVCGRPTEQAISVLSFVRGVWRRGKLESGFPLEAEIYISKANFIPHLKSMF